MSTYNELKLKQELLNFVRNKDIISVANRGNTTTSDTGIAGTGNNIDHVVTNSGLKNVRSVISDIAGTLVYGSDWELNLDNDTVTIYSSIIGQTYTVNYDYGSGDLIYDDFPREFISLSKYNNGRIGFDIISAPTKELGIGGVTNQTSIVLQFTLYARTKVTLGDIMYKIRSAFNENKKNFYRFPFINVSSTNNLSKSDTVDDKVIQQNFNVTIPFVFESN